MATAIPRHGILGKKNYQHNTEYIHLIRRNELSMYS